MSTLKLFDSGFRIAVELQRGARFDVDAERLHDLYRYTIRVHRSIVNKPLICQLQEMPYYLAPLKTSWLGFSRPLVDRWRIDEVVNDIPWDLVKLAADNWVTELQTENLEASIEDAIVQDRWIEYTRRYYALKLRGDLTPLSKPVDSPVSFNIDYIGTFQLNLFSGKPSMRIFSSTARTVAKVSKVSATVINP